MVAPRPVDSFDAVWPTGLFLHPRRKALDLGCCRQCGADVNPRALAEIDAREYAISALCPSCSDKAFALLDEEACNE